MNTPADARQSPRAQPSRAPRIALLVLLVVLACGVPGYVFLSAGSVTDIWRNPPLLPDGGDIQVQDFGRAGTEVDGVDNVYLVQITNFTTDSTPQQVYTFYKSAFATTNTWVPSTRGRFPNPGDRLTFEWYDKGVTYFIDVQATPAGDATEVQIGSSMSPDR